MPAGVRLAARRALRRRQGPLKFDLSWWIGCEMRGHAKQGCVRKLPGSLGQRGALQAASAQGRGSGPEKTTAKHAFALFFLRGRPVSVRDAEIREREHGDNESRQMLKNVENADTC